jgi:hypothetical protein
MIRLDFGQARLPRRQYEKSADGPLVAEVGEWKGYSEWSFSVPIGRSSVDLGQASSLPFEVGVRLGGSSLDDGSAECSRPMAATGGITVRRRGTLTAGVSAGLSQSLPHGCDIQLVEREHSGPRESGDTTLDYSPRLNVWVGWGRRVEDLWVEVAPLAGLFRGSTDYGELEIETWEPLLGANLGVKSVSAAFGLQVTVGQHRLPRRLYSEEGVFLSEFHEWQPLVEIALESALN